MRKLATTTFVTLDGVMQAPGGPEEDRTDGFAHGGWSVGYWDEMMGRVMDDILRRPFELLLGRRTYDIFAAYWPHTESDPLVAEKFNSAKKYVVSHAPRELSWQNSVLISKDAPAEVRKLKEQDGPELWVHGSGKLIQTLLEHGLIDRMIIWVFPVTVGSGKKLLAEGTRSAGFKLTDSKISTTGVVIAFYEPAGPLKTGSF